MYISIYMGNAIDIHSTTLQGVHARRTIIFIITHPLTHTIGHVVAKKVYHLSAKHTDFSES